MRKKYLSLLLISAVLAASLTGCGQKAAESDPGAEEATVDESEAQAAEIEQEFEFYSDKEDEMYYNLPDVVEQDGKSYELTTDISLETLGTRKVVQKVVESDVEDLAELPETMEYKTDSGNTYTLTNEQVYVKEKDATISIPVTDTVVYEDQYGRPSIPGTKTITYFNKVTGQDEEIQGTLQEFYESTPGHMKAGRVEGDASTLKRVACVDIAFINRKGERDETQLTVTHHLLTEAGKEELSDLFSSLAAELNACKTKIMYIGVVASADTEEELHELGY